eukprot:m.122986 g.122986  ORF g.122986 m.122986 type:complete len:69 (-) comp16578_c1_seq6:4657-4863(-)
MFYTQLSCACQLPIGGSSAGDPKTEMSLTNCGLFICLPANKLRRKDGRGETTTEHDTDDHTTTTATHL